MLELQSELAILLLQIFQKVNPEPEPRLEPRPEPPRPEPEPQHSPTPRPESMSKEVRLKYVIRQIMQNL